MGQKKYNQSMIKARQTLEYMVKLKCDQGGDRGKLPGSYDP